MKTRYDAEIAQKTADSSKLPSKPTLSQRQSEISRNIRLITACEIFSEPLYKTTLQTMTVHKDGTLEIKINHLPQTWVYRLIYHKANPE